VISRTAGVKSEFRPVTARRERRGSGVLNPLSGLTWRLPSGQSLAEFALKFGFLAPPLLGSALNSGNGRGAGRVREAG
jgi:hypothetical protein